MNSFKYKKDKKKIADTRMTILCKHAKMLQHFELLQKTLPEKYDKLEKLKNERLQFNTIKQKKITDFTMINRLSHEIEQLEKEINDIKIRREESEYITRVTPILIQYENMINADELNSDDVEENKVSDPMVLTQKLESGPDLRYYSIQRNDQVITKHELWKQYMLIVDPSQVTMKSVDLKSNKIDTICPECGIEGEQDLEGIICSECGMYIHIDRMDHETLSYKDNDRVSVAPPYVYKRINHFNEWLSQFQAKETTNIPQSVYDNLVREFRKYRINDLSKLNPRKIRNILKQMGAEYTKYYEHVPHIICKINKLAPPHIDALTEDRLRLMFKEVQEPYEKHKPKSRKNFLSYSYVLHKFFELLELDQYLEYFPYLKDHTKLRLQDDIFEKICNDLKWEFIPSI